MGSLHILLVLHMAAYLCLAQQQVALPPDLDGFQDMFQKRGEVVRDRGFVPQEEISHHQDFIMQAEVLPELDIGILQKEVERPSPFFQEGADFSPRGRKPRPGPSVEWSRRPGGALPDFPPGEPTNANIGSICSSQRVKPNYGPHNLPQTAFSHLTRQGKAINSIEEGFTQCCTQRSQVSCAWEVWQNGLDQFCEAEFSVKTKHYPCCKHSGPERQDCFAQNAPNPTYSSATSVSSEFSRSLQPKEEDVGVPADSSPQSRKPCSVDQYPRCANADPDPRRKLLKLFFPPGEPTDSCIQNICRLRKFRPVYTPDMIPKMGFGWMKRQAEAINWIENEYKECCKTENVTCAHDAWVDALSDFCIQELAVKTKHYDCCKETENDAQIRCFASKAPHPNYDKEIVTADLGAVNESAMAMLCGSVKLMTKQKQIPLLVKNLTRKCCSGTPEERVTCAEEQKELFIAEVCSEKKDAWKDSEKCCGKESAERAACFNRNYLQNISVASASTAE